MIKIVNAKRELKYDYYITEDGKVYSDISKKFLRIYLDKDGYEKVCLMSTDNKRHAYSVHRLVLENFFPVSNMKELQVNYKDGNKENNRLSNLEWCTASENNKHKYALKLATQKGEKNNGSKLKESEVLAIIQLLLEKKHTQKEIGNLFGVSADCVGSIKRKQNWKYLTEDITFD